MFALVQSWPAVCNLIERPDLIEDPHFVENRTGNAEVKAEFEAIFLEWLSRHGKQEIMERAQSLGYICGAGNAMEDTFRDRQLNSRGFFVEIDHPYTGLASLPRCSGPNVGDTVEGREGSAPRGAHRGGAPRAAGL